MDESVASSAASRSAGDSSSGWQNREGENGRGREGKGHAADHGAEGRLEMLTCFGDSCPQSVVQKVVGARSRKGKFEGGTGFLLQQSSS